MCFWVLAWLWVVGAGVGVGGVVVVVVVAGETRFVNGVERHVSCEASSRLVVASCLRYVGRASHGSSVVSILLCGIRY